jgi:CheY-like chemotaxis protein
VRDALPAGATLQGRHVVVVEDDPTVRSALEVLLRSWGAEVRCFESLVAIDEWVASGDGGHRAPDLLIVDHRLEPGRTGIEALVALRARHGAAPAIVVTGSTTPGLEDDAQAHDFHLLFKPVVPAKLRAMIAFKLGMR